jgi:hypothetical protein
MDSGLVGPAAFSQWDVNTDGLHQLRGGQPIEPVFTELDQDGDGHVSPQDLGATARAGTGPVLKKEAMPPARWHGGILCREEPLT